MRVIFAASGSAGVILFFLVLGGCAKGASSPAGESDVPAPPPGVLPATPESTAPLGAPGVVVMGAPGTAIPGAPGASQVPMGIGGLPAAGMAAPAPTAPVVAAPETCMNGDVAPCVCEATGTAGQRRCLYDATSPTMGYFSMCEQCEAAPDPTQPAVCDPAACPPPPVGTTSCCTEAGVCGSAMPMQPCM